MSHTITESSATFPGTLTMPDNTEIADAAFLELLLKALADRSQWLKALCTVSGVPRLANVADFAALKAIDVTTVQTHDVRVIEGWGLYQYDNASTETELAPWTIQPTAGAGRWIHLLANYPSKVIDKQIYRDTASNASHYYGGTTSYADVDATVVKIAFTCKAGDTLDISAMCNAFVDAVAGHQGRVRIAVVDGGTTYGLDETAMRVTSESTTAAIKPVSSRTLYTVVNAGTVTVKLQAETDNAGYSIGVNSAISLMAVQYRG